MTEAIFGLLGVIVGGLITAGTQFLTRRWETRDQRRVALRVLGGELSLFVAALTAQPRQPDRVRELASGTLDAWREHRDALASVAVDDWTAVRRGIEQALIASPDAGDEVQEANSEASIRGAVRFWNGSGVKAGAGATRRS